MLYDNYKCKCISSSSSSSSGGGGGGGGGGGKVKSLYFNWAHWGSRGVVPRILDLDIRWSWVVIFTPRPLYPEGRSPLYLLDRRLGGPLSRSGRGGEEKNSQPLPGLELPIIQPRTKDVRYERMKIVTLTVPGH